VTSELPKAKIRSVYAPDRSLHDKGQPGW